MKLHLRPKLWNTFDGRLSVAAERGVLIKKKVQQRLLKSFDIGRATSIFIKFGEIQQDNFTPNKKLNIYRTLQCNIMHRSYIFENRQFWPTL